MNIEDVFGLPVGVSTLTTLDCEKVISYLDNQSMVGMDGPEGEYTLNQQLLEEDIFKETKQEAPLKESIMRGSEIYTDFCMQCHLPNGVGVENLFPPLAKSDYLQDIDKSIHAIKFGLKGPIKVNGIAYNGNMINQGLDEEEIADVMNYILRSWGNSSDLIITEEKVASIEK